MPSGLASRKPEHGPCVYCVLRVVDIRWQESSCDLIHLEHWNPLARIQRPPREALIEVVGGLIRRFVCSELRVVDGDDVAEVWPARRALSRDFEVGIDTAEFHATVGFAVMNRGMSSLPSHSGLLASFLSRVIPHLTLSTVMVP